MLAVSPKRALRQEAAPQLGICTFTCWRHGSQRWPRRSGQEARKPTHPTARTCLPACVSLRSQSAMTCTFRHSGDLHGSNLHHTSSRRLDACVMVWQRLGIAGSCFPSIGSKASMDGSMHGADIFGPHPPQPTRPVGSVHGATLAQQECSPDNQLSCMRSVSPRKCGRPHLDAVQIHRVQRNFWHCGPPSVI